jgi:hypothetical protein
MHTLICAGGSSLRVLESILHFCAAGFGPKELRLLVVDPDVSNGNLSRTKELVTSYINCHNRFAGKFDEGYNFFGTKLDLLSNDEQSTELKAWSPIGVDHKLGKVIHYHNLSPDYRNIAHLLFTEQELDTDLDNGFRGHPAIGAAAMSLMDLQQDQPPWSLLREKIRHDVSQPAGSRVVIVGSVFGGTGASTLHPLARFLRTMPETNYDRLKIGVTALVPYFRFEASAQEFESDDAKKKAQEEMAAKSEWFALATKSALEFYNHLWNHEKEAWPFDAMVWVGNDAPTMVNYSIGGATQTNPAHFIELLSAMATLEFFSNPITTKQCYYSGPRKEGESIVVENKLEWDDFPLFETGIRDEVKWGMLRFFMTGFVHLGFFHTMLKRTDLDTAPHHVTWYYRRFAKPHDWLSDEKTISALDEMYKFFDVHYFPWWRQILDSKAARLFNPVALEVGIDLRRLAELIPAPKGKDRKATPEAFDDFYLDMIEAASETTATVQKGEAAYWNLLAKAADRFIQRKYKSL